MEETRKPARVAGDEAPENFAGFPEQTPISSTLRRIIQLSTAMEARLARTLGVNHTDLQVMQHLMQAGSLPPTELARRVGVTAAAATQSVDRLVAQGHATRERHPEDGRRVIVRPRPESVGRAAAELLPLIGGVTSVTAELSDGDAQVVSRFLDRVVGVYVDVLGSDSEKPAGHPLPRPGG